MSLKSLKDIVEELGIRNINLNDLLPDKDTVNYLKPETDLEFFQKPFLWPALPFAAVMKGSGEEAAIGTVYAGTPYVVYNINLFEIKATDWETQLERTGKTRYSSWEELLADGWECD